MKYHPFHSFMITRNGVYHDLTRSHYRFKVPDTKHTYVFSSSLHKIKFESKYIENRIEQNLKLKSRYRINIDTKTLPDIMLYKKIESRGFLIIDERGQELCLENLILSGEVATNKS